MTDQPADTLSVTDVIRADHQWFRIQFATLQEARGDTGALASRWDALAARLETHAAAEEALFYPRLLSDDAYAVDETKDAVKDHNEIRDALRDADALEVGTDVWWTAVEAANTANSDHMTEEEEGPLPDFERFATTEEQRELAVAFLAFEAEHAEGEGVDRSDKDPAEYVAQHQG